MAIFRGDQALVGWGRESSYAVKTAVTSGSFGIMEAFEAPDPSIEWQVHRVIGGDRDVYIQAEGKNTLETRITTIPQDLELLQFAFGQRVTSGTATGYSLGSGKTWVYTGTASGACPSMTIATTYTPGETSFNRDFVGVKVDRLTLRAEEEGELKMEMDLKASRAERRLSAIPTPHLYTNSPFLFHHGSLSLWDTAFARVTSFELTLANNLKPKYYLVSSNNSAKFAYDMVEAARDYELTTTVVIDDATVWEHLTSQTISGFTVTMRFAQASHAVDIVAEGCVINEAPHNIPEDRAEIPVEIRMKPRKVTVYEHYPPSAGY